jgi:hypothetical protein
MHDLDIVKDSPTWWGYKGRNAFSEAIYNFQEDQVSVYKRRTIRELFAVLHRLKVFDLSWVSGAGFGADIKFVHYMRRYASKAYELKKKRESANGRQ